jgi:FtsZ-binding cell division protein ZapB
VIDESYIRIHPDDWKQLLGDVELLREERDELRQRVENIKNGFEGGCYLCEVVGEMNKKLQQERDDAQVDQLLIEELWERRTEMTEMKAQIKLLREQRDEARRMACEFLVMDGSGYSSSFRAKEDALARGWDCYKETS